VSRSKFKKDPQAYTLFTCDTPHVLTSQNAEDISRLLKATVVTPSDRRFAELQAKYLSACTNSPAKPAKRMVPPDASGRVDHADTSDTLDLGGAREILQAHLDDDNNGRVTFALAETYDPNMLASWGSTADADTKRARVLYHKAFELGVTAAKMRLEALE
jgi:hypothetical protein